MNKQSLTGAKKLDPERLSELYQQKPNRRILKVIPISLYVSLYNFGSSVYDTAKIQQKKVAIGEKFDRKIAKHTDNRKKIGKLAKKKEKKLARKDQSLKEGNMPMRWGEPLAVYDSMLMKRTQQAFKEFTQSKGYFLSEVNPEIKKTGKRISVKYVINEGPEYILDSLILLTGDTAITNLIISNMDQSTLISGKRYDQEKLEAERIHIDNLLRNNGYYDFSRQYVRMDVDTSLLGDHKVALRTVINNPKRGYHKVFRLDSVTFTTDADVATNLARRSSSAFNRITYRYFNPDYSRKILDRRVFIYPGDLYSKENTFTTQRQLANLDMFKFININYDTTGGKFIANIFTSPLDRFQITQEVGVNVRTNQKQPGPFYNFNLKKRNAFGGLEILELSGRIGVDGVTSYSSNDNPGDVIQNSFEYGGNVALIVPQFILPFSDKFKSSIGDRNPRTRFSVGYDFIDRRDFTRDNLNLSWTYSWQKEQKVFYTLSLADLNLIDTRNESEAFSELLDASRETGTNFFRAFERSFVSSMVFTSTFDFNQYGSYQNKSSYLRLLAESGGTTLNLTGTSYLNELESYKFLKFSADFRRHIPLNTSTTSVLAYRVNFGVGVPYSDNNILPYEKNFFAGGSNSNRAWGVRRLGPGSFVPDRDKDGILDYSDEQSGEMILEASLEFRKKLIGFLDGALFFDAGNIWTLSDDLNEAGEPRRPGAKFEGDRFYKEIAIGTGVGFRFDFTFLVMRLDLGVKVYEPGRPEGQRWVLDDFTFGNIDGTTDNPIAINIGIGYPF